MAYPAFIPFSPRDSIAKLAALDAPLRRLAFCNFTVDRVNYRIICHKRYRQSRLAGTCLLVLAMTSMALIGLEIAFNFARAVTGVMISFITLLFLCTALVYCCNGAFFARWSNSHDYVVARRPGERVNASLGSIQKVSVDKWQPDDIVWVPYMGPIVSFEHVGL